MSTIPALAIRRRLGRNDWHTPIPFGPDGWRIDHTAGDGRIFVTAAPAPDAPDGGDWWHASISWTDRLPSYEDLAMLHAAVWPNGYAAQVFAPPTKHINIHERALHLWGRPDGRLLLPDFGMYGTI